ncbi:hypothetical protein FV222_02450 [Methylobacterium sp. WL103]|uniref:hypothetical protein n=1 Tax=Methylobacterium sp. WL103 TaxID=2603891 RepID=UPI0011C9482C|nr:hypothetical protein [Methylobacterium sp. WL103]TXN07381.1 hypothetical protein FV222_02450 [Methylobacterium sp. WL103]
MKSALEGTQGVLDIPTSASLDIGMAKGVGFGSQHTHTLCRHSFVLITTQMKPSIFLVVWRLIFAIGIFKIGIRLENQENQLGGTILVSSKMFLRAQD